jgi:Uma2 family endonuclease
LPQGGDRSPDLAWVSLEKWENLTQKERDGFPPICPDFVIELRSKTDRLASLQAKMREYLASGLLLGWLINPQQKQVEIYRQNQEVEIVNMPITVSGENILPGLNVIIDY